jgi:integrase
VSYNDLLKIANIVDNKMRLKAYIEQYSNIEVCGFHYINFIPETNTISISMPDHTTHHESTSFLIFKKNIDSINTTKGQAEDLKKFLDFLLIWEIDLMDCDLYVILLGFTDYLRCIKSGRELNIRSIAWATTNKLILNDNLLLTNNILNISYDKEGFMGAKYDDGLHYTTIKKTISTAIQFISFLKDKTYKYSNLPINQIPQKYKYKNTFLSGTLGKQLSYVTDIEIFLRNSGLTPSKHKESLILTQKVFTIDEVENFLNYIPTEHHQNKLLFYMLKAFGLRVGETANIMIDNSSLPSNFLLMEHFKARDFIKNNLRGDIEYYKPLEKWVCNVIERENEDFRSQHKSGSRAVPLLFPEELFLDLLVNAIKERELLIRYTKIKHSFLFVSRHSKYKGSPINGKTIGSRFETYTKRLLKQTGINLTSYSPHSFRHFFATYLLRELKEEISDVSRWLGHSSTEITRTTYSHYLPRKNEDKEVVKDMAEKFQDKE